jgi:hypothetical protein
MAFAARKYQLAAVLMSLLFVSTAVVRASSAAFSDTTDNPDNSFATGNVTLTDDDGGATAMFSVTNAKPGVPVTKCINVTYAGTLNAEVRMYADIVDAGTGLADYLDIDVVRGSGAAGGNTSSCNSFTPGPAVWSSTTNGDLLTFATNADDYASGVGAWAVTGGGGDDVASYQITVEVQDDDAAEGKTAPDVLFTWEAQNT